MSAPPRTMRIGDLASRTGVSVHSLRVWERRYGLLTPGRSPGGYRLYGPQDEWRVREMVRLRDEGVPAAQAAATALSASRGAVPPAEEGLGTDDGDRSGDAAVSSDRVERSRDALVQAFGEFDGAAAHAVLDDIIGSLGVESAINDVILPALRDTGDRWESGEFTVAQEHYASSLLRSRLGVLALTWESGTGPVAVLACPPGELHELGLLSFGVILGRAGWRVHYLGANTPVATLASATATLGADLVVLSGVVPGPLLAVADAIEELDAADARALTESHLVVAGAGATPDVGTRLGATVLSGDPVTAARVLAERPERHTDPA